MTQIRGVLLGVLLGCWWVSTGYAQMFSYSSEASTPLRSVGVNYQLVDFQYDGEKQPSRSFDYKAPAYGVFLAQPNLTASLTFGQQSVDPLQELRPLRLIDASLFLWGGLSLLSSRTVRIFVPIIFHSGYRSVDEHPRNSGPSVDAFNLTTLGLGTGLGFQGRLNDGVQLQGRVTPLAGLALRSLEGTTGNTHLMEGNLQVHLTRLIRQYGLTFGYNFRYQRWNIEASDLFPNISDNLFDYKSLQHVLRIGVNW